mmetsp:Transcript_11613/g.23407  ORF Transcript_11613/g.23407 Transcript_11613/m.23407 type:complete len:109 (+) Transcript_11613:149-475(+)
MRSCMNGGIADELLKRGKENLDRRLPADCDAQSLCRYTLGDFSAALTKMQAQWEAAQQPMLQEQKQPAELKPKLTPPPEPSVPIVADTGSHSVPVSCKQGWAFPAVSR